MSHKRSCDEYYDEDEDEDEEYDLCDMSTNLLGKLQRMPKVPFANEKSLFTKKQTDTTPACTGNDIRSPFQTRATSTPIVDPVFHRITIHDEAVDYFRKMSIP